jgi:hypothetical protein
MIIERSEKSVDYTYMRGLFFGAGWNYLLGVGFASEKSENFVASWRK